MEKSSNSNIHRWDVPNIYIDVLMLNLHKQNLLFIIQNSKCCCSVLLLIDNLNAVEKNKNMHSIKSCRRKQFLLPNYNTLHKHFHTPRYVESAFHGEIFFFRLFAHLCFSIHTLGTYTSCFSSFVFIVRKL